MRIVLIAGAFLAAATLTGPAASPGEAAPYQGRWCAQMPIGNDAVSERCDLRTIEECRREIVGVSGHCVLNPYYRGPDTTTGQRPRPRDSRWHNR